MWSDADVEDELVGERGQWWCGNVHVDLINHIQRQMGKDSIASFTASYIEWRISESLTSKQLFTENY